VSAWHPAVDVWDRQRAPGFFDSNLQTAILDGRGPRPQALIEQLIDARTGIGSGRTYSELERQMIDELRGIVGDPQNLDYLRPLTDSARDRSGLWVATLNYDLAVERASQAHGASVYTGIEDWIANRAWNWATAADIKLLKLHGSIDWRWDRAEDEQGQMPVATVVHTSEPESDSRTPVVLFGQRGKLREEGPFLSLLAEFELALAKADRLVVMGYSFRDPHINTVIRRWTRGDLTRTMVVVDPNFPDNRQWRQDVDFRKELLAYLTPPSWKSEPDFPNRLDVLRVKASEALALLSSSS
jgi:SIR2-like domain